MGAKKAKLIFLLMTFLISNSLFSCSKPLPEIDESVNEIKIVCNESKMKYISDFIDEFKTEYPQYKLIIDFEPDEKIEYYINHDQIDADIVLANELITINGTDDKFVDISRNEYTNEFGKNALVHLKTLAGKIYASLHLEFYLLIVLTRHFLIIIILQFQQQLMNLLILFVIQNNLRFLMFHHLLKTMLFLMF